MMGIIWWAPSIDLWIVEYHDNENTLKNSQKIAYVGQM